MKGGRDNLFVRIRPREKEKEREGDKGRDLEEGAKTNRPSREKVRELSVKTATEGATE